MKAAQQMAMSARDTRAYNTEHQERAAPIDHSTIALICVLNALSNVEAPLLRRLCKAGARLCCSILVPLLQLLEIVAQQGGLIVPTACICSAVRAPRVVGSILPASRTIDVE